MPLYTYQCDGCGDTYQREMTFAQHDEHQPGAHAVDVKSFNHANDRDDGGDQGLTLCGWFRQVLGFHFARSIPDHYNHSLDAPISSTRGLRSELSRQSDEMSARMGFDVAYETVDHGDPTSLGVTDAGLEATRKRAHDTGAAPLSAKSFS